MTPAVEEAVLRALAHNPDDRFPDVQAFVRALAKAPAAGLKLDYGTREREGSALARKLALAATAPAKRAAAPKRRRWAKLLWLALPALAAGAWALGFGPQLLGLVVPHSSTPKPTPVLDLALARPEPPKPAPARPIP